MAHGLTVLGCVAIRGYRDPMQALTDSRNPFAFGLLVVGFLAGAGAAVLAIVALNAANDFAGGISNGGIAAINAWSEFLFIVFAVCVVGAVVLGGCRWLLRVDGPAATTTAEAPAHRAPDAS